MSDATHSLSDASGGAQGGTLTYSFEIRGGRTGFRRRPILGDRFLIGSDPICDLRLDSRLAAPLHGLVLRTGDRLEIESITDAPMSVNGRRMEAAELAAGDVITIGGVRLIVHAVAVRFDIVRLADDDDSPCFTMADRESAVAELSATKLVDLIENEQERCRDLEVRRCAGATALLDAVRRSRRPGGTALEETHLPTVLARLTHRIAEVDILFGRLAALSPAEVEVKHGLIAHAERLSQLASSMRALSERIADRAA